MDRKNACAVTYFADAGSSEGDCHAALNFAAVMEATLLFICRNNGWAISTPTSDHFRNKVLKMLSRPPEGSDNAEAVVEMRNPLAFGHFANDPGKDMDPNVMICPYDFPLSEKQMRPYIPNVAFGNTGDVVMRKFGSLWFRKGSNSGLDAPVLKTLVLLATRAVCNEELMLNYRLSNSERRPVDEEED